MNLPFFIAETPRGGDFGHCFIVPPGPGVTEVRVDEFCHVATQHATGANFVAIRRQVEQHLPTGTVRLGVEILLLAGVDYPQLTAAQQQRLAAILRQRLVDLEQLIAHIAWAHERQGLRVIREELAAWVEADHLAELPLAQVWDRPQVAAPPVPSPPPAPPEALALARGRVPRGWPWRRVIMMIASLLVVLMLGGVLGDRIPEFLRQFLSTDPPSSQLPCSSGQKTLECFVHALKTLADACEQKSYADFVSAVHRAILPPKTVVVSLAQKQQELYDNLTVWDAVAEQYARTGEIKPYTFLKDRGLMTTALRDLLSEQSSDLQAILAVRRHLAQLGIHFARLQTQLAKAAGDTLPEDEPFAQVIRHVQSLPCAACQQIEPVFPFLAQADQEVVGVFHALFLHEATPLRAALPAPTYAQLYTPERSVRSVLLALAAYTEPIRHAVEVERERAENATPDDKIRGYRTRVYKGLRNFLVALGAILTVPPVSLTGSQ